MSNQDIQWIIEFALFIIMSIPISIIALSCLLGKNSDEN